MRYAAALAAVFIASVHVSLAAPTCTSRQYLDPASGTCKTCPSVMLSCSSATTVVYCQRGRFLHPLKKCVVASGCPEGTFADSTTATCKKCYMVNAAKCSSASANAATACVSGSCLSEGKCLYINRMLPSTYCSNGVVASCGNGASRCDSTGKATTCKNGFNLSDAGSCVQCTGSQVWNTNTKMCEAITCRATATARMDYSTEEYVIDSPAQYFDSITQTCKTCLDPYAKSCGSDGLATACIPQFRRGLSDEGTCDKCDGSKGYYFVEESGKCELYCPTARYNWRSTMLTTVAQHAVDGACANCADPLAYSCKKTGVADDCVPWAHLENGACVPCPQPDQVWDADLQTCVAMCNLVGVGEQVNGGVHVIAWASYFDEPTRSCKGCGDLAVRCDPATGKATECMAPTHLWDNGYCGF